MSAAEHASLLSVMFAASKHSTVHSLDVLGGPLVDVALCVPVPAVVLVVVAGPYPSPLVVPLRRLIRLLVGTLLLEAKQRRKKGPLPPPHC
jgi:hypothetical protein